MELIDHVFSQFCQEGVIKQDILNMMEQFGLIVKFATSPTNEIYFVPCQLKTPPEPLCKMEPSPSDPCPLYLDFLGSFVPHGLFLQFVSRCTRWCSMSGFKQPPNLFDGAAQFFIGKEPIHQLIFICKKRFIKIVLKQEQMALLAEANVKEVAIQVRKFLEDTMQNLTHKFPWLKNLRYRLCVECPCCLIEERTCLCHGEVSCTHEDFMCLLQVAPDGLLSCPSNWHDNILILRQLKMWYSIEGEADMIKRASTYLSWVLFMYLFVLTNQVRTNKQCWLAIEMFKVTQLISILAFKLGSQQKRKVVCKETKKIHPFFAA